MKLPVGSSFALYVLLNAERGMILKWVAGSTSGQLGVEVRQEESDRLAALPVGALRDVYSVHSIQSVSSQDDY